MRYHFLKKRSMPMTNKAKPADAGNDMKAEYNNGASIADLAAKYDMRPADVEAQVVTPAEPDAQLLQSEVRE